MTIRKRTPGERAAALIRRLNEPRHRKPKRRSKVFVTTSDVQQIFREAARK